MEDSYGIAIDIGTSGLRAQSIELTTGKVIATAITMRHPLPGANVMDHLHFAIDSGKDLANEMIIGALNLLLKELKIDLSKVRRIGVCGNPIQLSLFQNMEIRDLAYAGERAKKKLGVENVVRNAKVIEAGATGLGVNPEAEVYIPPSVKHEIGADALAMMYETDFLSTDEIAMVTDYGTNAEMALKVDGEILTGSAAAGPAIEGEHISMGMLAAPGAISDVDIINGSSDVKTFVLDDCLMKRDSDVVDPMTGRTSEKGGLRVRGLTGTGVIALVATGLDAGFMRPGKIPNEEKMIRLQEGITFTEEDLVEVGKTMAAFMAGHATLVEEAGISIQDVGSMYMTGASGTYVDAFKSMKIGLVPGSTRKVWQVGNTSLALARDLVSDPGLLDGIQDVANSIRAKHVMFANEKVFENAFAVELGVWTQGMPHKDAEKMRAFFHLDPSPELNPSPEIIRLVERDIDDLGREGLTVVEDIGITLTGLVEDCDYCMRCVKACNEDAIAMEKINDKCYVTIRSDKCMGTACRRCERRCRSKVLHIDSLAIAGT